MITISFAWIPKLVHATFFDVIIEKECSSIFSNTFQVEFTVGGMRNQTRDSCRWTLGDT